LIQEIVIKFFSKVWTTRGLNSAIKVFSGNFHNLRETNAKGGLAFTNYLSKNKNISTFSSLDALFHA
jgi:hypothetical protein